MTFFTLQSSADELELCIRETNRIDWDFGPVIAAIYEEHMGVYTRYAAERKITSDRFQFFENIQCIWLPIERALNFEYTYVIAFNRHTTFYYHHRYSFVSITLANDSIPGDVYVTALREEHVLKTNETWNDRNTRSPAYLESLIRLDQLCIGLFERKTDELLCWVYTHYFYAIS